MERNSTSTSSPSSSSSSSLSSSSPPHHFSSLTLPPPPSPPHHSHSHSHVLVTPSDAELSNSARLLSATMGSVLTSLIVIPFDVIKTRIQTQSTVSHSHSHSHHTHSHTRTPSSLPHLHLHPPSPSPTVSPPSSLVSIQLGVEDAWCNICNIDGSKSKNHFSQHAKSSLSTHSSLSLSSPSTSSPSSPLRFRSSTDAFFQLIRHEGVSSLYRGLSPTLIHSVPNTVIYFWAYDKIKILLNNPQTQSSHPFLSDYSPILSGMLSRSISTTIVAPIELVKTRSQSMAYPTSAIHIAKEEIQRGGFLSLWRGASPTLWRDVPFSAIYWILYENIKSEFASDAPPFGLQISPFWVSFFGGASSGMVAAAFTHPFDIIKTRRQMKIYSAAEAEGKSINGKLSKCVSPPTTLNVFSSLIRDEGYKGLTSGLTARMAKIVPACAIMISTYEFAKSKMAQMAHTVNTQ